MNNAACPEPEFKLFVRERFDKTQKCLNKKVSWAMSGIVVAIFTVIAFLVFNAYSGEQGRQREETMKNSAEVQELKTNVKVMQVEFGHVRGRLQDLKNMQKEQFDAVMEKLNNLGEKGGAER